jgi:hypothetical protein
LLYLLDLALSFVSARLSLILFFLIAVFYAVAPIPAVGSTRLFRPLTGLEKGDKVEAGSPDS